MYRYMAVSYTYTFKVIDLYVTCSFKNVFNLSANSVSTLIIIYFNQQIALIQSEDGISSETSNFIQIAFEGNIFCEL